MLSLTVSSVNRITNARLANGLAELDDPAVVHVAVPVQRLRALMVRHDAVRLKEAADRDESYTRDPIRYSPPVSCCPVNCLSVLTDVPDPRAAERVVLLLLRPHHAAAGVEHRRVAA